ncbi:MAG: glutamate--tRNA ligase family protein [Pirellulaceae bacterium]
MLASGAAYWDYSRPDEIQAERAAAEAEGSPTYRVVAGWPRPRRSEHDSRAKADKPWSVSRCRARNLRFDDLVRGQMEFEWEKEADHVIQQADGSCLYHLANVVDDQAFGITHVVRAVEHLANTPRQIFIAQSLGYPLPTYAHLPFVAEPGSKNKLSKRKLDKYLKHPDFKSLHEHGEKVMQGLGRQPESATFNPVIVDFYREVGYLPEAILNYLLLLGWSLDDHTEDFDRAAMIEAFSLERVVKAPASFDPAKLMSFQHRYEMRLDLETRYQGCRKFLIAAGWMSDDAAADIEARARAVVEAAGDRIRVAGDVLEYSPFFLLDRSLEYEPKAFKKRVLSDAQATERLAIFRDAVPSLEDPSVAGWEAFLQSLLEREGWSIGQVIHALRVAVTGSAVGFGMYESLAILGPEVVARRIDETIAEATRQQAATS